MKFLHALKATKADTPTKRTPQLGRRFPPQKKFNRENLKFGLKFSVCTSMTSGLIQTTCREPGVITWLQLLDGLPAKIWEGEKTSKIRRDF